MHRNLDWKSIRFCNLIIKYLKIEDCFCYLITTHSQFGIKFIRQRNNKQKRKLRHFLQVIYSITTKSKSNCNGSDYVYSFLLMCWKRFFSFLYKWYFFPFCILPTTNTWRDYTRLFLFLQIIKRLEISLLRTDDEHTCLVNHQNPALKTFQMSSGFEFLLILIGWIYC